MLAESLVVKTVGREKARTMMSSGNLTHLDLSAVEQAQHKYKLEWPATLPYDTASLNLQAAQEAPVEGNKFSPPAALCAVLSKSR